MEPHQMLVKRRERRSTFMGLNSGLCENMFIATLKNIFCNVKVIGPVYQLHKNI